MKFNVIDDDYATMNAVWTASEDECPMGFEPDDVELFEMSLEQLDDDRYEFNFYDMQEPVKSWCCILTIPDAVGTPACPTWYLYIDGKEIGSVDLYGGNVTENVLLGIYDAIERWFND